MDNNLILHQQGSAWLPLDTSATRLWMEDSLIYQLPESTYLAYNLIHQLPELYIGTWLTIWYISYLALHGWDSASPQLFDSSYLADTLMPQLPDPTWLSSWIFQPTWHGISRLIDSSLLDICLKLDPPKLLGLFLESVVLHCLQVVVHTWNMAQFFSSPTPLW